MLDSGVLKSASDSNILPIVNDLLEKIPRVFWLVGVAFN